MFSSNIRVIFTIAALCISFSAGAPIDNDSPTASKLSSSVMVLPEYPDTHENYIDLSVFCNENEVIRKDNRKEQHCPLNNQDEQIDESYDRNRACICADGYFRHPNGFCTPREGCFVSFRI